jgi:hypothetical protein
MNIQRIILIASCVPFLFYSTSNLLKTHQKVVAQFPEFEFSKRKRKMNKRKKYLYQIIFLIVFSVILLSSCTSVHANTQSSSTLSTKQEFAVLKFKVDAVTAISGKGYSAITLGEFSMDRCNSKDSFGILYSAKNWLDRDVQGVVMKNVEDDVQFVWRAERK